MNIEEVKACRDLGFEIPFVGRSRLRDPLSRLRPAAAERAPPSQIGGSPALVSLSETSDCWDDPREVKARLKVWAQAVALA
ncbi:hypothetical protein QJS04_geneDACA022257 [Acorus gramineus]|uniref:Uncharacterized protein n=1 Tax=Acorus gramineus TaxID=55184 RepID=A0AAV9BDG7_ACOGR|nr:hypothetical protein QJS04_geneDACA022257 [Acorus gramineus]